MDESDPNFWYNPEDWYDKVAEGDELRHFKHLREVGPHSPDFRIQLKANFPEGTMSVKHEFLKPGQTESHSMSNESFTTLMPLLRYTSAQTTLKQLPVDTGDGLAEYRKIMGLDAWDNK